MHFLPTRAIFFFPERERTRWQDALLCPHDRLKTRRADRFGPPGKSSRWLYLVLGSEKYVGVVVDFDLVTVNLFLALDTVRSPRHSGDALRRNIFVAMQAYAV